MNILETTFLTLLYISGVYTLVFLTWILYIAAMQLRDKINQLHAVAKVHAYVFGAVFLVFDVLVNLAFGTMIFLEPPQEFLLTSRLKRLKLHGNRWQKKAASWICEHLLNQFDPTGKHC